jgi:hypothetical protein
MSVAHIFTIHVEEKTKKRKYAATGKFLRKREDTGN